MYRSGIIVAATCLLLAACLANDDNTGSVAGADGAVSDDAVSDGAGPCTPSCAGKTCGDDGCGGSCGTCQAPTPSCIDGVCSPATVVFQDLRVVSAVPASEQGDGSWVRQCDGGPIDGILLNTVLVSTERRPEAGTRDRDRSIRPGDTINLHTVSGPGPQDIKLDPTTLSVALDCLDPLPDSSGTKTCEGAQPAAANLASVEYFDIVAREVEHNVLILIDQSGSMLGLVEADSGIEKAPKTIQVLPSKLQQAASDYTFLRLSRVKEVIQLFNDDDHLGALAFGEGLDTRLEVPCALPEVDGLPWYRALDTCFAASDVGVWLDPAGLDSLQGSTEGRANLWEAVLEGYKWLTDRKDFERSNHIIVIGDGPDTCAHSERFGDCQPPCSEVTADLVRAQIAADQADPNVPGVQIHFVQWESMGYRGPDPLQVKVACETGGHYQFINSEELPKNYDIEFHEALSEALFNVRLSMMGYWQLGIGSSAIASGGGPPAGTPPGFLYAASGFVEVEESSQLVSQNASFVFAGGGSSVDERPVALKPCGGPAECGADAGFDDPCRVVCSGDTGLCAGGAAGVALPDAVPCLDGSGGSCCEGQCLASGQVCTACQ